MANHVHRQIREGIESRLAGLTTSGARVYANRLQVMEAAHLPGLRIFMDSDETLSRTIHSPALLERQAVAVVECCARASSNLDDTLDLMSQEVETAMASGISVTGQTLPAFYQGMEFEDEQLGQLVGVKRLRFAVPFETLSNAPDVFV